MDSLKIVATSEESTGFGSMTLTKDELTSGLETRKCIIWIVFERLLTRIMHGKISGITKSFTTETDVPALKLSFLVAGIAKEEKIQDSYDEGLGKLERGLQRKLPVLNDMQLRNYSTVASG